MSGYHEGVREAAAEYASEMAFEMLQNGTFNNEIIQMILDGEFDDAVKRRLMLMMKQKLRELADLLKTRPQYEELDDVGGMESYAVQAWGSRIDEWFSVFEKKFAELRVESTKKEIKKNEQPAIG